MSEFSLGLEGQACLWHDAPNAPNKRGVRAALHAMTGEAVGMLVDDLQRGNVADNILTLTDDINIEKYDYVRQSRADYYAQACTQSQALRKAGGHFDYYATTSTTSRHATPMLTSPMIPIGAYGQDPATNLLTATVRAIAFSEARGDDIESIGYRNERSTNLLQHHTFKGPLYNNSLLINVQEGIVNTAQTLALLTATNIGPISWEQAVTELVERDKVTEYARKIGVGLLSRQVIYGHYVPEALQGDYEFTASLLGVLKSSREESARYVRYVLENMTTMEQDLHEATASGDAIRCQELSEMLRRVHLTLSGGVCPAANERGEIYEAGKLLLAFLKP